MKTTCGEHRTRGYTYRWKKALGKSTLTCKGCGFPPEEHETMAETITRLTGVGWSAQRSDPGG